jgi:transposase
MAIEGYWADPMVKRERFRVTSLDSAITQDDPVRLLEEILSGIDWSAWEGQFQRKRRGQPPIHPRVIAAAILYGLFRGIRSSRKVEEACCYRLDFQWLVEGRRIDHSTISKFRTKFHEPLKDLFRQIGHVAMRMGMISLGVVAFDGTRVKANNGRFETRTRKSLEKELGKLDAYYERCVEEQRANDVADEGLGSPTRLPESLAAVETRRRKIAAALEQAQAADAERRQQGIDPEKNPAQIPMTDPDSKVMPNKEGGYAPNYTPVATTDGHLGFILHAEVLAEVNESSAVAASVDRIEETFGKKPECLLADAGNSNGQVMRQMEERGVEFYAPVASSQPPPESPAYREDPRQPVPESEWGNLKRNSQGQIDRSCFIYVAEEDQYYCPLGKPMPYETTKSEVRGGTRVTIRMHRCPDCVGCPLYQACVSSKCKRGRTISRDEYEEVRERTAARMATPHARQLYNQRPRIAETTFGILKRVMGVRQFLLRGLEKVNIEWRWATTAFNLKKLVHLTAILRAESAQRALAGAN